ncbi:MAG TPA: hypothetical protein VHY37_14125 [Tepidisphaeraceae bacterium]|jgi:hypothetical protein|nr:hypothetical protein [Tepidisphaeraceae bacterium]
MYRTALIGTAIVAGCLVGGCNKESSSSTPSNQAVPSSVSTPANNGANAAQAGAKDAGSNDDQAKISAAFQKLHDDLAAKKIDDASKDIKDLQDMKGLSAEQQQDLQKATAEVQGAQNAVHMNPATMPGH